MVYARAMATATRLILKYGQSCTWRQIEPAPGSTPAKSTGTVPTDFPCTIVFLNHKREQLLTALSMIVGAADIPSGGLLGLMAPVPFEPSLKDMVFRSTYPLVTGERYGISDKNGIEILAPNEEGPILYKIRLVR